MSNELNMKINHLVEDTIASYKEQKYIVPQDFGPLPNRDVIITISKLLRQLLFPGYFGKKNFEAEIVEYHVGDLLIDIYEKLSEQITFALKHGEKNYDNLSSDIIRDMADQLSYKFLCKISEIREFLATDVQAAFEGDPAASNKEEIIFSYPGIYAISLHRLAHELNLLCIPLIPRIMSEYAHSITGIDIHPGAVIGKYFFIDHGTGVVIGETTTIGNNVKLYQGVTLGALSTRGGQTIRGVKRHPTLEDNVTVYSGVSILGGETIIGNGAVIGSNAFITKSIPSGTKVSIRNPELLFKDSSTHEFKQEFIYDWII
jgi:serine O-acetyltransferase